MKRNKYIDHTLLKPEAKQDQIRKLCEEAMEYDFRTVCVNPYWVSYCASLLESTDVGVCTVIGFPLGACTSRAKAFETADAIADGAEEVDMVINIGELKAGHDEAVKNDIEAVVKAADGHTVKVILETCLLSDDEIRRASELCVEAGADFVKTSTGFNTAGANVHVVEVIKETVGDRALVKAAGGVRCAEDMEAMIAAGADRIGTSRGVDLMK